MTYQPDKEDQDPPLGDFFSSTPSPALPSPAANHPSSFPKSILTRKPVGYSRVPSVSFSNQTLGEGNMTDNPQVRDHTQAPRSPPTGQGLGIDIFNSAPHPPQSPSPPAGEHSRMTSNSGPDMTGLPQHQLSSPQSFGGWSGSTRQDETFRNIDTSYDTGQQPGKHVKHGSNAPSLDRDPERTLLRKSCTTTMRDHYFDEWTPKHACNSAQHFKSGLGHWLAITILVLAVFSTFFSGAYLVLALRGPFYGRQIGNDPRSSLAPTSAAFLTSFFAKLIELSFVAVVVAFLGQVLTRRAYHKDGSHGVTLAELNMRNWILAPSTMFVDWHTVKYASISLLGVIAVVSTVVAMLYTTAATALVQPQLRFFDWTAREMQGQVQASFANPMYLQADCKLPILESIDTVADRQEACTQIQHASQAYYNYQRWMSAWAEISGNGTGSSDLAERPPGSGLLNDNVTLTAPWIDRHNSDMMGWYEKTGWIVNNVTMAMPHAGVVAAATNPGNRITQPDELNGFGLYNIRASVPAPFVNVLCVQGLTEDEISPLVYDTWEGFEPFDVNAWPQQLGAANYSWPYLGGTTLDEVFKWGPSFGERSWPPVFPKLPLDHNSLGNDTGQMTWGRTSVYILAKGGSLDQETPGESSDGNYALCSLKAGLTPHCSTHYNASSSGGSLEAVCDGDDDEHAVITSTPGAIDGNASLSADWPNVASSWIRAINLNSGILDSNASQARIFTNLILTNESEAYIDNFPALNPAMPSLAEALSVMAGNTLIQSTQNGPLAYHRNSTEWHYDWSYARQPDHPPEIETFQASIRAQQYASGGTQPYHNAFYPVLVLVFVINIIALVYFLSHRDWYTDFSDPVELFPLAINSPPSEKLAECTCAGGAKGEKGGGSGERFTYYWKLGNEEGHVFMESPEIRMLSTGRRSPAVKASERASEAFDMMKRSPVISRMSSVWRDN